jgi:septal ring factor EnvC (AmiA/AmiB activator)
MLKEKEQIVAGLKNKLRQIKKEKNDVTKKLVETKNTNKEGKSKS